MKRHYLSYDCADCCICTRWLLEYYMVKVPLWRTHGIPRGMLCIGCLETRVGRTLTSDDFKLAVLNLDTLNQSPRLRNRLGDFAEVHGDAILRRGRFARRT